MPPSLPRGSHSSELGIYHSHPLLYILITSYTYRNVNVFKLYINNKNLHAFLCHLFILFWKMVCLQDVDASFSVSSF